MLAGRRNNTAQRITRSGLKNIHGPGPSGYGLKSALAALPRLKIQPVFPAHGALPSPILGHNAPVDMFETASSPCLKK